jgi:succinate dehydrogenase/fumarate reductase iron-sulfur protein
MFRFVRSGLALRRCFSSEQPAARNETSVFFESVTSTVKGYLNPNYIVEHDPSLTAEERGSMKRFLVYKYDPENPRDEPKYVSYYIDLKKIPPMYLDALLYIKDHLDSTLAFRRSCREGICGSCAMNCDGLHTLACIREIDADLSRPALITPLGHMFVLKDLVVDMTNFYAQYKTIQPYLRRKEPKLPGVRLLLPSNASTTSRSRTARSWTGSTSACSAPAVPPRAPPTGGTPTSTSAPPSCSRPTVG